MRIGCFFLVLILATVGAKAWCQDVLLENGIPKIDQIAPAVGQSATLSATQYFFDVPSGATEVFVSLFAFNPLHDIDLEIRVGERIGLNGSTILSDYFSETVGSGNEAITLDLASNPPLSPDRYYIGVVNYEVESVSFTLLAQVQGGTGETPTPTLTETPTPSTTSTPSTTPTRTQTPTPSITVAPDPTSTLLERADFDGNQRIDSRDLLLFQSLWAEDWSQSP